MKTTNGRWKRWMALGMAAVLMAPVAMADRGDSRGRGEAGVRASAPRVSAPSVARSSNRGAGERNNNNRGYERGRSGGGNAGRYPILEALRDSRYNDQRYNDRYDRHGHHDDDMADAVKAAAIANAVVGVVGILANAGQPHCPPPMVVAPAPPRGHYVTERVLVQPGHYEQVRAWVPQTRDPYTGCIVGGYYEVQNRWVPDVYELREVWVAY